MEAHPNTRWIILESVFDEVVTWFRVKVSPRDAIVMMIGVVRLIKGLA